MGTGTITEKLSAHDLIDWEDAIADANVANHLFLLEKELLGKPGLITASWKRSGALKRETVWTFSELQTKVIQCVLLLQRQGLCRGDRVLLMVRPGMELITLCFALFRLGAIPIVIDPGMGISKFKKAVAHSQPVGLVGIPIAHCVSRLFPKSFQSIQKRIEVHPRKFLSVLAEIETHDTPRVIRTESKDLAAVLFTSGSTGAPKGVCYEHGMFDAQIQLLRRELKIESGEVDLPMLPIFALFNPAMGMTTVIPEINPSRPATVNPAKIIAAVERYNVTNSFGSPVLWRKIGDHCDHEKIQLKSLRRILVAGAAAPTQLYRQFQTIIPHGEMYSPYGATECLPVSLISGQKVLGHTAESTDKGEGICVGKPLPEVQVKIISPSSTLERGGTIESQPQGTIGEILVHGPSVTKEYDRLPEATAKAKILDEKKLWHRMGDMGYLDSEGLLWFCGRKVEMIRDRDGTYLFTEKVEGPFLTHPHVKRCALTSWSSGDQSEQEVALVVQPEANHWPSSKSDRLAFAQSLQRHIVNSGVDSPVNVFFFMKSFPVDVRHNAKIHRLTLQKMILKQTPVKL